MNTLPLLIRAVHQRGTNGTSWTKPGFRLICYEVRDQTDGEIRLTSGVKWTESTNCLALGAQIEMEWGANRLNLIEFSGRGEKNLKVPVWGSAGLLPCLAVAIWAFPVHWHYKFMKWRSEKANHVIATIFYLVRTVFGSVVPSSHAFLTNLFSSVPGLLKTNLKHS